MRKNKAVFILCISLVLLLAGMGLAEKVRIKVRSANVRLKPSLEAKVIGTAPMGSMLEVLETEGEWYKVNLPPDASGFVVTGYVHSSIVELVAGETEAVEETTEAQPEVEEAEPAREVRPARRATTPPPPPPPPGDSGRQMEDPYYEGPRGRGGMGFGIKLSGGLNYLMGGDYNKAMDGMQYVLENDFDPTLVTGEYKKFGMGMEFGGEILINFTPNIGIGLGAGYISASQETGDIMYDVLPIDNYALKLTAIPLKLTLHFGVPMGTAASLDFSLGGAYYLGSFDFARTFNLILVGAEIAATGSVNTIGFHGGLGFSFNLSPNFAFFIEAQGRYAKFSGIEADYTDEGWVLIWPFSNDEKRTLYYYETTHSTGETISYLTWSVAAPTDPAYSNIREGSFDLSGIFFGAGFKIMF
ncbi:MAG: SH3 domain-containing protein [Candidatus Aminicenantes bacterium]|nr:SH3 domain-containing protein [Candidatus Aminicenantes bacterium]